MSGMAGPPGSGSRYLWYRAWLELRELADDVLRAKMDEVEKRQAVEQRKFDPYYR